MLRPEHGTVPFTGRAAELDELRAWLVSDPARAVRVLCGEAGVGKSRLALQIAAEHHADGGEWRLVPVGQEADTVRVADTARAAPLLLIVEHAETREGLDELLRAVLKDPGPVRVLLTARVLGEWWDQLVGASDPAISQLLSETEPLRLAASVSERASDTDLAEAAVPYFTRALSADLPGRVTVEPADRRVPVLVIHAATLLALARLSAYWETWLQVIIGDHVLEDLLQYEAQYWQRAAAAAGLPTGPALVKQVLAASSLLGAASVTEAAGVVARVPGLADCPNEERVRWAQWLERLCPPGPDGRLGALQPDMLAEAHVVSQLAADSRLAQSCLRGLSAEQAERALTVLARAGEHQDGARRLIATALRDDLAGLALPASRVARQGAGDLGELLADALDDAPASPEVLTDIALGMPYPSAVLALAHMTATTRVRESLPDDTEPETLAEWDDREARLRSELGSIAVRRKPGREAASSVQQTAAASPGRSSSRSAPPATSPDARFSELGRPAEELTAAEEAVTSYRELAAADPDQYRADLASSLASLAIQLSEAGRPADALAVGQEAVTMYRKLDASSAGRYGADLAAALMNLGTWLSGLGRSEDALVAVEEAVTIYRDLAAANPEYRRKLAHALSGLAMALDALGRDVPEWDPSEARLLSELGGDAAERPAKQLASPRRLFSGAGPAGARRDPGASPADSVAKPAAAPAIRGRPTDPRSFDTETTSTSTRRAPAASSTASPAAEPCPDPASPASAPASPAAAPASPAAAPASPAAAPASPGRRTGPRTADRETLPSTGRAPAAPAADPAGPGRPGGQDRGGARKQSARKAAKPRSAASSRADRSRARADSHDSAASAASEPATPPRRADPQAAGQETAAPVRPSAPKPARPAVEPPKPTQPEDPVTEYLEGVAAYRELANANPGKYRADLATALNNLGLRLFELGRTDEALEAGLEALTIRRELDEADPRKFRAELATCLVSLGVWFSKLGRPQDALKAEQEAVSIRRELVAIDPARYRPDLAGSLTNLGITLSELGRPGTALGPVREAMVIYRDLAGTDPKRYRPDLARCLANLGIRYAELDRPAEALSPTEEAVAIRRELARGNPDRYRPDLARSLVNLGLRYSELGRPTDAMLIEQEAVILYRGLADASPEYRRELVRALKGLAAAFGALGHGAEAAERAEGEAAKIMQDLEQSRPCTPRLAGRT